MKCKFCGCSEDRACVLAGEDGPVSCSWIIPGVCTNPVCVEKAYGEARPLAETIDMALRLGLIEAA